MCKQNEKLAQSLWDFIKLDWKETYSGKFYHFITDENKVLFWSQIDLEFASFCAHETAYKYPITKPENGCQFIAYKCGNGYDFYAGECADEGMPLEFNFNYYDNSTDKMNETKSPNNLFIKTSDSYPYCLFHYQIVVKILNYLPLKLRALTLI